MDPSKTELAILNNVQWYEGIFTAHGLSFETNPLVWLSHERPPPFHSNLVVLSKAATLKQVETFVDQIARVPGLGGWSMKDSYACLELGPLGFSQLFEANWIWMDPLALETRDTTSILTWTRISSATEMSDWEGTWAGDPTYKSAAVRQRQFPDQMLLDRRYAFLAGRSLGEIVAGAILNQSPDAVGVSNVFAQPNLIAEVWPAVARFAAKEFHGVPLVGYERGAALQAAQHAGFLPIGRLRVWCRGE